MASNNTTNTRKIVILVIIVALIIINIYFIPRLVIIGKFVDSHGMPKEYYNIGLSGVSEGDSVYVSARYIEILVPVDNQVQEDFYLPYTPSEGVTTLRGNGYEIMIRRHEDEFLYVNEIFPESSKESMMYSDNAIEYMIKALDIQYKDLSIFQPLDDLEEVYRHYSMKSTLLKYMGARYCVFDDGTEYLFFAMLNKAKESNSLNDVLTINVYDMNNNYNLEATIEISKSDKKGDGISEEDVRFIVLNTKILDKGN